MRTLKGYSKVYIDDADKVKPGLQLGLFAAKNIKKGEQVFVAKGELIRIKIKDRKDSKKYPNALGIGKSTWINPTKENPLFYLNHSCMPNVGIKGRVTIVALRNIKKGEHITIDYSITEEDLLWQLDNHCLCGTKECRKKVRSIQYLPYTIYKRYLPYVNPTFQRAYLKHKQNE